MRLLALLFVASCGSSSPPPAQPPAPVTTAPPADAASSTNTVLAKMIEFKDALCACKDTPCAQHVSEDMTKWASDQAGKADTGPKPTDDELKQMNAIGQKMGECMSTAMGASSSPSP